jgi:hypothetical protein
MQMPDVNILVYAHRREDPSHGCQEKLAFRSQLKRRLGDRKIDVLVARADKSRESTLESLGRFAKL